MFRPVLRSPYVVAAAFAVSAASLSIATAVSAAPARSLGGMRADAAETGTYLGVEMEPDGVDRTDEARHHAFLGDVLSVLRTSPSPIAANTLRAVESGVVHLDTLDRMTVADCRHLLSENPANWNGVVAPAECGEGADRIANVPAAILARITGFQNEDRIYVHPARTPAEAASTVVHETNHVLNRAQDHYRDANEILREEYRAYWVASVYEDGHAPGGAYLGWLKRWIIDQYALRDVRPSDLADRPDGNLDNDPGVPIGLVSFR